MSSLLPRRDPKKNYFPMPNEIFSMGLSAEEIAVYAYLMYRENRKSFQCWPSYNTIGKALKMSRNTVRKYVRQLEDKGFILTEHTTVRTQRGERRNGNLLYQLRPMREPIAALRDREWAQVKRTMEIARLEKLREQHPEAVFEVFPPSQAVSRI
jgi:predicted transcriptional regulator